MAQKRTRLSPEEVKEQLRRDAADGVETEGPFHTPFAAALAGLQGKQVKDTGRKRAAERLAERAGKTAREPSELAIVRARHKAARKALAEAVKPVRRTRKPDSQGE